MRSMGWNWIKRAARSCAFALCVGLLFSASNSGCQGTDTGKDSNDVADKGGQDRAGGGDTSSQDRAGGDTGGKDEAGGGDKGVLSAGAKCSPGDTCEAGHKCCATCCGAPPPPDSGPRDPNYQCVKLDPQFKDCPAIP